MMIDNTENLTPRRVYMPPHLRKTVPFSSMVDSSTKEPIKKTFAELKSDNLYVRETAHRTLNRLNVDHEYEDWDYRGGVGYCRGLWTKWEKK